MGAQTPNTRRRAAWRRRLAAVVGAAGLHGLLFLVIVGDWNAHAPPQADRTMVVTLERTLIERPAPPSPPPPPSLSQAPNVRPGPAAAAISDIPGFSLPALPQGRPAAPARAPSPSAAPTPPLVFRAGCHGRPPELMTPAERRACEEQQARAMRALPDPKTKLAPTPLDREFAAAYAKRRENDPSVAPRKPTDCANANLSGCSMEGTVWNMRTLGKELKSKITGEPPEEDPIPSAAPVFSRQEIYNVPKPR